MKHLTLQGEVWHTAARVLVVCTEPCVAMLHAGLFYSVRVTIRNTFKKKKFEVFLSFGGIQSFSNPCNLIKLIRPESLQL